MNYDRLVIGYHGCTAEAAEAVLAGEPFRQSTNDYDWLGRGVYFWEYGLDRAWAWAEKQHPGQPAVVGALIQLGQCFDLLDTRYTSMLGEFAERYIEMLQTAATPVPRNVGGPDLKGRFLDCAVINWTLQQLENDLPVFQTVRCVFTEGKPVFDDGAGTCMSIHRESHIQVVVRDQRCIVGRFRPAER